MNGEMTMHSITQPYINQFRTGFLQCILQAIHDDKDLDLYIRKNYVNVYYKGNSLFKLTYNTEFSYKMYIDPKFIVHPIITSITDTETAQVVVGQIPQIKANIIRYGKKSLEIEYEQLIIRANNRESRTNPEYFIVDRQYAIGKERLDLTGVYWDRTTRHQSRQMKPCIFEIKYALNSDLKQIAQQIERYYHAITPNMSDFTGELTIILRQRLQLGLYEGSEQRLRAMEKVLISSNIEDLRFVVVLVDYNPNSALFDEQHLRDLSIKSPIFLLKTGFGMWSKTVKPVKVNPLSA